MQGQPLIGVFDDHKESSKSICATRTSDTSDTETQLEDGATTIVLRRFSSRLSTAKLLEALDEVVPAGYDFVYLPYDRRKKCNISLAFINFVDHTTAKTAYDSLRKDEISICSGARVSQAHIQGLGLNLAYFLARCGTHAVENPRAPLVFKQGGRVQLAEMVEECVAPEMMEQMNAWAGQFEPAFPRRKSISEVLAEQGLHSLSAFVKYEHPDGSLTIFSL
mmetsp:Transcript_67510/g.161093  ORF Transcript_67510/g.161093 Transcript_67510/m.161093 type:complete len:221 (-) Transcript_67510:214-876(-)